MTPGLSRTFDIMYDHTFSKFANHHIRHQATHEVGCQQRGLHMVTLVFLRDLCGYVWVSMLTLSPWREHVKALAKFVRINHTCKFVDLQYVRNDDYCISSNIARVSN